MRIASRIDARTALLTLAAFGGAVVSACNHQKSAPARPIAEAMATAPERAPSDAGGGMNTAPDQPIGSSCYIGMRKKPLGEPKGLLWKPDISAVIRDHVNQVQVCYNDRLRFSPGLAGRVEFQFSVGPDGRIRWSRLVSSTVGDMELETCIGELLCGWQFPIPFGGNGEVHVTYPFVLQPATATGAPQQAPATEPHKPAFNPPGQGPAD